MVKILLAVTGCSGFLAVGLGAALWLQPGPGTGPEPIDASDFGDGIFGASNGDVLACGFQRVDGQEYDLWLRRYDADGVEQ